jgi:hypothetical protein
MNHPGERSEATALPHQGRRSRSGKLDQDMSKVVHPKAQPLPSETDDTRASGPDHLDRSTVMQTHLAQAMNRLAMAVHAADAAFLPCTEQREGYQIGPLNRDYGLT